MAKPILLVLILLCTVAASAQLDQFWEEFDQNRVTIAVGSHSATVAAAIDISLKLQYNNPDSDIEVITHEQVQTNPDIIITTGDIEQELQTYFDRCNIDTQTVEQAVTFCPDGSLIVYAYQDKEVIALAKNLASGNIRTTSVQNAQIPRETKQSTIVEIEQEVSVEETTPTTQVAQEEQTKQDVDEQQTTQTEVVVTQNETFWVRFTTWIRSLFN